MFKIRQHKKEGMKEKTPRRCRGHGRSLALFLLIGLLTLWGISILPAAAQVGGSVVPVSSEAVDLPDGILVDGVTYIPFRAFATSAEYCEIRWDGETKTATAIKESGEELHATVGEQLIRYGARRFYTVTPVKLIDDRVYVPIRPMARAFGYEVEWNAGSRSVTLRKVSDHVRADEGYYASDAVYWLSRIISAEAGGEPLDGQIAVGNVILNRAESGKYPATIYGVIFDRVFGVQFTPTANGTIYREPLSSAIDAAKICLEGYTLSEDILYFFNPRIAQSDWIAKHCEFVFRIGGHDFYR